ncbi:AAA family ATPase [Streptosporangium sp. DT93]|uniref:MinD/ParA family ATP-binding protein n=1 Tax=Streptosporangium sp. DT93 TaxID=3393428 RepID=UPI003CEB0107
MARHDREESLEEQLAWLDAIKEQEEAPALGASATAMDDAVVSPYPKDPWSLVPTEPDTTSSPLFRAAVDSAHPVTSEAEPRVEDADAAEWLEASETSSFTVPAPASGRRTPDSGGQASAPGRGASASGGQSPASSGQASASSGQASAPGSQDDGFLAPLKPLPRQESGEPGESGESAPADFTEPHLRTPFAAPAQEPSRGLFEQPRRPAEQVEPFTPAGSPGGSPGGAFDPESGRPASSEGERFGFGGNDSADADTGRFSFGRTETDRTRSAPAGQDRPADGDSPSTAAESDRQGRSTDRSADRSADRDRSASGTAGSGGSTSGAAREDRFVAGAPDAERFPPIGTEHERTLPGSATGASRESAGQASERPGPVSERFQPSAGPVLPPVPASDADRGSERGPERESERGSERGGAFRTPEPFDADRTESPASPERPSSSGSFGGERTGSATSSFAAFSTSPSFAPGRDAPAGADRENVPPTERETPFASERDTSFGPERETPFAFERDASFASEGGKPFAPEREKPFTPDDDGPFASERETPPAPGRENPFAPAREQAEPYQPRRRQTAPAPAFGAPARQHAPGGTGPRQSADSLDPESLLRGRRNGPSGGWRKLIFKASAGLIKPGESPEVRRRRELVARARTPVATGHHRVAVLSLKGGVGKTTTTVGLGATLAQVRGDRVIAVDANPDRGTLSDKVELETSATVRDLLNERQQIKRYVDIRAFTSQAPSRLEILASDRDPSVSEAFSASDYQSVSQVLENFYSICITDCGTGLLHSAMSGVLGLADQLVLVSSPSVDGARAASATLDWLEAHHYEELVRSATVVLCSVRPRSKSTVDLDRLEAHFAARCRAVVRVPYDPHLEEGAEIDLERLQGGTRDAYLRLAASVGDGFAGPQP